LSTLRKPHTAPSTSSKGKHPPARRNPRCSVRPRRRTTGLSGQGHRVSSLIRRSRGRTTFCAFVSVSCVGCIGKLHVGALVRLAARSRGKFCCGLAADWRLFAWSRSPPAGEPAPPPTGNPTTPSHTASSLAPIAASAVTARKCGRQLSSWPTAGSTMAVLSVCSDHRTGLGDSRRRAGSPEGCGAAGRVRRPPDR